MAASLLERICAHEGGHVCAANLYGIPIISVSVNDAPHTHRARYRAPHDLGLETIVTMCLCGPAAEELFCGAIEDGSDAGDL